LIRHLVRDHAEKLLLLLPPWAQIEVLRKLARLLRRYPIATCNSELVRAASLKAKEFRIVRHRLVFGQLIPFFAPAANSTIHRE
jgi:hypothetical protein